MEGRPDPPNLRGIIPNSFQHIFEHVAGAKNQQFLVRASYLEIYNEEIRDLLSKDPKNSLELKENIETGVYVKDLTTIVVKNVQGKFHLALFMSHLFPILNICIDRNRPRHAVRKEESFRGGYTDEPDVFSLSLHLHRGDRVHGKRCHARRTYPCRQTQLGRFGRK